MLYIEHGRPPQDTPTVPQHDRRAGGGHDGRYRETPHDQHLHKVGGATQSANQ